LSVCVPEKSRENLNTENIIYYALLYELTGRKWNVLVLARQEKSEEKARGQQSSSAEQKKSW